MLLREVAYARPSSVDEAVHLLATTEGARALAGGQTLVNVMKARAAAPDALVDLNRLDELRGLDVQADGTVRLGAMVTSTQLVDSQAVRARRPVLAEVCGSIADVQVRNRGTVGGNVCANDPTNHLPPLMVALDARMTIVGPDGERVVPADEFFLGVYLTAVAPGELLTAIEIPAGRADGFAAVTIGQDGTCLLNAAVSLDTGRVALGCVDAVPHRATAVEGRLRPGLDADGARLAVAGLGDTLDPPSDVHAPAPYRRRLAEVVAARAILQATGRAG